MKNKSIEEELKEVMADVSVKEEPETEEIIEETEAPENEEPIEKEKDPIKEIEEENTEAPDVLEPEIEAPVSLSGAIKAKWNDLPADVRAEWKKREDDIHRMMTAKDGDLNLGRSIKEIASPYEAVIRSEGGTVEGAFKDLLNTAYVLRTGNPDQKAQLLLQTAQQFGVDLKPYLSGQQQQNPISSLQQEIHQLKQMADPSKIKSQLQEEMERDRINSEIQAFSANPENVHFQTVKSTMGSLIQSGRAKNLQEAYDMAIWSDPSIRSDLLKAQQAKETEKKKAEMAAKKKASASVAGSTGIASPNTNAPQKSLEEELREQMRSSSGKI